MSATTSTTSAAAASGWAKAPIIPAMPALVMAPPARSRSATSGSPRARSHPQPRAAQSPQKPPVAADGARPMLAMEILPALANAAGCVPSELDESRRCPSFQDTWRFRLLRRPADPRASRAPAVSRPPPRGVQQSCTSLRAVGFGTQPSSSSSTRRTSSESSDPRAASSCCATSANGRLPAIMVATAEAWPAARWACRTAPPRSPADMLMRTNPPLPLKRCRLRVNRP